MNHRVKSELVNKWFWVIVLAVPLLTLAVAAQFFWVIPLNQLNANSLPKWLIYGQYLMIIVAGIYCVGEAKISPILAYLAGIHLGLPALLAAIQSIRPGADMEVMGLVAGSIATFWPISLPLAALIEDRRRSRFHRNATR